MSTCKYCGAWVAGKFTECGACRRRAAVDWRFRAKWNYKNIIGGKKIVKI